MKLKQLTAEEKAVIVDKGTEMPGTGEYEDFLTGFVTAGGDVWGRPVGVTVASDGSLLVSDDGSNSIWRVSFQGNSRVAGRPN